MVVAKQGENMSVQVHYLGFQTTFCWATRWRDGFINWYRRTVSGTASCGLERRYPYIHIYDGDEVLGGDSRWTIVLQTETNEVLIRGERDEPADWPENASENILDTEGMSARETREALLRFVDDAEIFEIVLHDARVGWLRFAKVRGHKGQLLVASGDLQGDFAPGRTPWIVS